MIYRKLTCDRSHHGFVSPAPRLHRRHPGRRLPPLSRRLSLNFQCNRWVQWIGPSAMHGGDRARRALRQLSGMDRWLPGVGRRCPRADGPLAAAYYDRAAEFFMRPDDPAAAATSGHGSCRRCERCTTLRPTSPVCRLGVAAHSTCVRKSRREAPSSFSVDSTAMSRSSCRCSPQSWTRVTGSSRSTGRVRVVRWRSTVADDRRMGATGRGRARPLRAQ